jgi:hypothetical protein
MGEKGKIVAIIKIGDEYFNFCVVLNLKNLN